MQPRAASVILKENLSTLNKVTQLLEMISYLDYMDIAKKFDHKHRVEDGVERRSTTMFRNGS